MNNGFGRTVVLEAEANQLQLGVDLDGCLPELRMDFAEKRTL